MLAAEHTAHAQSMQKRLAESDSIHGALHVCARPEKLYSLLQLSNAGVKITGQHQFQQGFVQSACWGLNTLDQGGWVWLGLVPAFVALLGAAG